jgi:hypothetical protein
MTKTLDPDQQAVYYAERTVFEGTLYDEPLHTDDLMGIANRLFATDWWQRPCIPSPIIEPTSSSDRNSYASYVRGANIDPYIRLAPHDINARILAHEAAHVAQFHFYNPTNRRVESHGREFRAAYVSIAEIVLGRQAAVDLKAAFDRYIPVRPEHAIGKPGSIVTVPKPDKAHDPEGIGLLPSLRLHQQLESMAALRPTASSSGLRVNGAIAL